MKVMPHDMLQEKVLKILDLHEVYELESNNGPRLGELPNRPHEGWHTSVVLPIVSTLYFLYNGQYLHYINVAQKLDYRAVYKCVFLYGGQLLQRNLRIGQNVSGTNILHSCVKCLLSL